MSDLKISELLQLAGSNLAAGDFLPVADVSASETRKITVTDFFGNASTLIADATIPSAKILFTGGSIPGSALEGETVNTSQITNDAISAAKLGDNSSVRLVTTLPTSGDFVGQIALDTDDLKIYCWNGSVWQSIKAAGSVNTIVGGDAGVVNVTTSQVGDTVTINTTLDNTAAAAQFLAGPSSGAGAVAYRAIVGADLPTATTTEKGAVVVNGNGLAMSGNQLVVDNTVTENTSEYHLTQYNAKGLVTAGRSITAADLPPAAAGTLGAVYPGDGLTVDAVGELGHSNAVSAGSGAKITFDAQGHVTGTLALEQADIPDLPATKLTTGTLSATLLPPNGIEGGKFANFSTTKFGSADSTTNVVTFPSADYSGQFFYDTTNEDLYLYSGVGWIPVTAIGGEIVFAGTFDASSAVAGTGVVEAVSASGTGIGLTAGAALPAADTASTRYYLVVSKSGTPSGGNAPNVAMVAGDLILSTGTAWQYVGASSSTAASSISITAIPNITATNVQGALAELQTEKAALAGATFTGDITFDASSLVYDTGSYNTTISAATATAARTITFPDVTGTVVTTGDIGSVSNTMLAGSIAFTKLATLTSGNILVGNASNQAASVAVSGDITISNTGVAAIAGNSIVDADINTSAGIAFSKLAALTSGNILVGNASNQAASVALSGDATISNTGVLTLATIADTKLATITTAGKVSGGAITSGTIAGATAINTSGAITTSGTVTVTGETILKEIRETVFTLGTSGSIALDPANGGVQTTALSGNPTFTDSLVTGQSILLVVANGSSYTVTWPTITWITANGNVAPTLTSRDMIAVFKVATTLYGAYLGSYA